MNRPDTLRRRGVALVLVLVAVGVVVALSCAYLAEQALSVNLSQNVGNRLRARLIAESGLEMALHYVLADGRWRSEQVEGVWVSDHPFAGGSFTISGQDGVIADDGTVVGDGSLSNSNLDPLTLTCVGRYGAAYTAQAVVYPTKRVLMIVADPSNLTAEDVARRDLLRGWGWQAHALRSNATEAQFDAAVQGIDAIYFPAHVPVQDAVKSKLRTCTVGLVIESAKLVKELGLVGVDSRTYSGAQVTVLPLTRWVSDDLGALTQEEYTHYVTEPFAPGLLTICREPAPLLRLDGPLATSLLPLAVKSDEPGRVALSVLDNGGLTLANRPARAVRVVMPWGGVLFNIGSLNFNGRELLRRALDYAGGGWTGLMPGVAVWGKVEVLNSAWVDGFNPALGCYGPGNVNHDATVSTNATGSGAIRISGTLYGDAYVVPEGDAVQIISATGTITGQVRALPGPVPLSAAAVPNDLGASAEDLLFASGEHVIDSDRRVNHFQIAGDAIVRVQGHVRLLCDGDVRFTDEGQLLLDDGASLTVFTSNRAELSGSARFNMDAADPARLNWVLLKDGLLLRENARGYASVRSYGADLRLRDSAKLGGTFTGRSVRIENSAAMHVDTLNSGTVATLGARTDLRTLTGQRVRWVLRP